MSYRWISTTFGTVPSPTAPLPDLREALTVVWLRKWSIRAITPLLAVVRATLKPFMQADATLQSIARTPFQGQFAYIATMVIGVTYVRYSLDWRQSKSARRLAGCALRARAAVDGASTTRDVGGQSG